MKWMGISAGGLGGFFFISNLKMIGYDMTLIWLDQMTKIKSEHYYFFSSFTYIKIPTYVVVFTQLSAKYPVLPAYLIG